MGECVGFDGRCKGSAQTRCKALEEEGSDCQWHINVKKSELPHSEECVGNDSRCKGTTHTRCKALEEEGSDCRWQINMNLKKSELNSFWPGKHNCCCYFQCNTAWGTRGDSRKMG